MRVVVLSLSELTCPAVKEADLWRRVRLVSQGWLEGEVGTVLVTDPPHTNSTTGTNPLVFNIPLIN